VTVEAGTVEVRAGEARRLALRAQGFGGRGRATSGTGLRAVIDTVQVLQVDPINVVARAQYLPAFSRRGPYPVDALDRMMARGELFEYFAHDASLVPIRLYPLLRWRMDAWAGDDGWRSRLDPTLIDKLLAQIASDGPTSSSALAVAAGSPTFAGARPTAWASTPVRSSLRWLWASGQVVTVGRRGIEHVYDLAERAIPSELQHAVLSTDDARRELLVLAARALGVGTARDLADYFRLGSGVAGRADRNIVTTGVNTLLAELVEDGRLLAARVEGWKPAAFLDPDARPGPAVGRSLLSPFDSLVWERDRVKRLFGFDYRLEIYVPRPDRIHGYYVYPFLLGRDLVARVDLRADRTGGTLVVPGAFLEPGQDPTLVAGALADELALLAGWLGLTAIRVEPNGDLAVALSAALA
jgi:uncharacterized protein YcaQ